MVEQRDVAAFGALDPAGELGHIDHSRAGFFGDGLGRAAVQVWIHENAPDFVLSHFRYHFREMSWRGRNAGLGFEEQVDLESKPVSEIEPRIVIRGKLLAFERR